jgi:hypothetical protein
MKRETFFLILVGIALLITFAPPTLEFFRSRGPSYCNKNNSCVGQGCSMDPSNQPCNSSRTTQKSILTSDPDWGTMLGGQTVEVCADTNGNMMDPNVCSECSVCGLLYPESGNTSSGLCVPLTKQGCMKNAPPDALLQYLNNNPEAISCCGN